LLLFIGLFILGAGITLCLRFISIHADPL
jgi:hypothetical protein